MGLVRDTARITRSGRPLPDVHGNELSVNAWLVWEAAKNEVLRGKDPEQRSHEGVPGYVWRGTVTSVFKELWSGMHDSYTGDKAEVIAAKKALGQYLRDTVNMVCLDRGQQSPLSNAQGTNRLPTWWVRTEWNPAPPPVKDRAFVQTYAERRLTPTEAGEDRTPAPVEVRFTESPVATAEDQAPPTAASVPADAVACPDCGRPFASNAYAVQHRQEAHPESLAAEPGAVRCHRCQKPFLGQAALTQHLKYTGHGQAATPAAMPAVRPLENRLPASPAAKAFPCPDCEKAFDDQRSLSAHLKAHQEGAFPCRRPGCDVVTKSEHNRASHESSHDTADRFLAAAVELLLERGEGFSNGEVAERAGMPYAETLYRHFTDKADLLARARAVAEERGLTVPSGAVVSSAPDPEPEPAAVAVSGEPSGDGSPAVVRHKIFLVAAFAASVGAPLSFSAIRGLVNGVNVEVRAEAVRALVADGRLRVVTVKDVKSRDVDVYLPTEPVDFAAVPSVAETVAPTATAAAAVSDPLLAVQALVADYERLRQAAARDGDAVASERRARRAAEEEADGLQGQLDELKAKMRSFANFFNEA